MKPLRCIRRTGGRLRSFPSAASSRVYSFGAFCRLAPTGGSLEKVIPRYFSRSSRYFIIRMISGYVKRKCGKFSHIENNSRDNGGKFALSMVE